MRFTTVERQPRESRLALQRFGCYGCQRSQRFLPANLGIATDIAVVAQKHEKRTGNPLLWGYHAHG